MVFVDRFCNIALCSQVVFNTGLTVCSINDSTYIHWSMDARVALFKMKKTVCVFLQVYIKHVDGVFDHFIIRIRS